MFIQFSPMRALGLDAAIVVAWRKSKPEIQDFDVYHSDVILFCDHVRRLHVGYLTDSVIIHRTRELLETGCIYRNIR